jgi:hypothetical protein
MPAKPKARKRSAKAVKASRRSRSRNEPAWLTRRLDERFEFELVDDEWPSIEIKSESGVIKVRMLGDGQKEVPVGSVMLWRMLGPGNGIDVFEKHIPTEIFWTNLALLKHSPEYIYWMHAADYDHAVRRLSRLIAA